MNVCLITCISDDQVALPAGMQETVLRSDKTLEQGQMVSSAVHKNSILLSILHSTIPVHIPIQ